MTPRSTAPAPTLTGPRASRRVDGKRLGPKSRAALILAAAVGVPAFAAPGEWRAFRPEAEQAEPAAVTPMPFEEAGSSFPGSAFYYLDDTPDLAVQSRPLDTRPGAGFGSGTLADGVDVFNPLEVMSGDPARAVEIRDAGPAARAFRSGGTGLDKARALQCLTQAVYYEAASESTGGQKAVAQVVLNRVMHPTYPASVCGVVYQGSERRTGCQFTFTCDGSMARKPSASGWARARRVAAEALAGDVYTPVGYATHYHTTWINPYWASSLDHIGTIGAHRFYRWKGSAGRPGAFRTAYVGGERIPRPSPRSAEPLPASAADMAQTPAATDPVALARAYEEARAKAAAEAGRRAPPPVYTAQVEAAGGDAQFTAEKLPGAGAVRPEYANAGQWKPGAGNGGNAGQ
ncbi:cell wall hydrolase [Altererythrobacter sp. MTPC7]|uniref:cell wall hydrolase n=1 Tax=Altererythrobacter sp. MTPC7 TaxID=3056567 RepID=UPI0036F26B76